MDELDTSCADSINIEFVTTEEDFFGHPTPEELSRLADRLRVRP